MKKIKSIHFVGIKGVGMTPLAIIAKEAGLKVTGCDLLEEFITDKTLKKAGIAPFVNFSENHINDVDLVITTGAHGGFDNPEVKKAKEKNIKVLTQGEAVGVFMNGEIFGKKYQGISIAGCHGKTTTTAILATILKENKYDPSFLIGTSSVSSLSLPGHFGKGKYFIAEADEYATEPKFDKTPKLLWQNPKIAIFTNIEFDHPDLYNSIDEIREVFLKFAQRLERNGVLIACGDDFEIQKILKKINGQKITFGFSPLNDYFIKKISVSSDQTFFWVEAHGTNLGEFVLNVSGEHNALNALGAIIAAFECGLKIEEIKASLKLFKGSKRRLEFTGELSSGALLFDDYAHHPTEIKKTLKTLRQGFPKSQIVCIFQPHTYSRTKKLFDDFIYSFKDANLVIITNIYASLREKPDNSVSGRQLATKLNSFQTKALFLPKLKDVIEYFKQNHPSEINKNAIIVTLGAGDIYKIHEQLRS